jgi:hypothetical protein
MRVKNLVSMGARTMAFAGGSARAIRPAMVALTLLVAHSNISARAETCPGTRDEIATDRPDVTNSSVVVPAGSLQIENGINASARVSNWIFTSRWGSPTTRPVTLSVSDIRCVSTICCRAGKATPPSPHATNPWRA